MAGESVSYNVFVYNVQAGELRLTMPQETAGRKVAVPERQKIRRKRRENPAETSRDSGSGDNGEEVQTYIVNTNSGKFHLESCNGAKRIKEENRQEYTGTRQELIEDGYQPCKTCNP